MALDLAKTFVSDVTFRSQVTPDYTWDPFGPRGPGPSQGGIWGWLMRDVVRPAAYVRTPGGLVPLEPYGPPQENYLPVVGAGTALAGVVVGGVLFALGMWWERRKRSRS